MIKLDISSKHIVNVHCGNFCSLFVTASGQIFFCGLYPKDELSKQNPGRTNVPVEVKLGGATNVIASAGSYKVAFVHTSGTIYPLYANLEQLLPLPNTCIRLAPNEECIEVIMGYANIFVLVSQKSTLFHKNLMSELQRNALTNVIIVFAN